MEEVKFFATGSITITLSFFSWLEMIDIGMKMDLNN